jgi:hypothetical protein
MYWAKQGLIIAPATAYPWMSQYAAVPTALYLGDHLYRIFFAGRDSQNRSQTEYVDIDIRKPHQALQVSAQPILSHGSLGQFDEHGAMVTWIVDLGIRQYMYYIGWNIGVSVPFRNALGLAISEDAGKSFYKYAAGPILDRSRFDPCFVASACMLIENGIWRMWYLSCIHWSIQQETAVPHYHIKYAESVDGIEWKRTGVVCIDFKDTDEHAISRPCVIKDGSVYRMWYSYRGHTYRIGYAESYDGIDWQRLDNQAGIDVSLDGWDAEMIEYPYIIEHGPQRYMLYNGNGYGRTGIGLAIAEYN